MNLIEKILARASGRRSVAPGDVVIANVETALTHDLSGHSTSKVYDSHVHREIGAADRAIMVFDHMFSPPTADLAQILQRNREFCRAHGIRLYGSGHGNLHHVAMRNGHVAPGTIVVGNDSHSTVHGTMGCLSVAVGGRSLAGTVWPFGRAWLRVPETITVELVGQPPLGTTPRDIALWLVAQIGEGGANYAALRFAGEYLSRLGFWDRWLFPLMAVDVGAKCGFIEPDEVTAAAAVALGVGEHEVVRSDPGERPARHWTFDVSDVPPVVACPPTIGNVVPIAELVGTPIDRFELGGHGGGRSEDFTLALEGMRSRPRHPDVDLNLVPSSRQVFAEMLDGGQVATLHARGGNWFPACDGSNQAINMGAMAAGEAMLSTHARNFPGRNGSPQSKMFIASALSVAAAATHGRIVDPREVLS